MKRQRTLPAGPHQRHPCPQGKRSGWSRGAAHAAADHGGSAPCMPLRQPSSAWPSGSGWRQRPLRRRTTLLGSSRQPPPAAPLACWRLPSTPPAPLAAPADGNVLSAWIHTEHMPLRRSSTALNANARMAKSTNSRWQSLICCTN